MKYGTFCDSPFYYSCPCKFPRQEEILSLKEGNSLSYTEPKWFLKNSFAIFPLQSIQKYFPSCSSILASKNTNIWQLIQSSKKWLKLSSTCTWMSSLRVIQYMEETIQVDNWNTTNTTVNRSWRKATVNTAKNYFTPCLPQYS